MNEETEKQILEELRALNASIRKVEALNRRMALWGSLLLVVVLGTLVFVKVAEHRHASISAPAPADSWDGVRTLIDRDDLPNARAMLTRLMGKHPNYHYGYVLMATTYMVEGNFKEAERNDARAFELYPSEQNAKALAAARQALERQASTNYTGTARGEPKP